MTQGARWLAILLVVAPLAGCIGTEEVEPTAADPGSASSQADLTRFTKIHTPSEIVEILEGYEALPAVDVEEIGRSFEDRPLHLATVGQGPFELWIVGRQHGDEPTGGEAILLAIEALADPDAQLPAHAPPIVHTLREHRTELLERLTFFFVPVANPDGAAAYQRTTALGMDPNRDHYLFTQPAIQALREAFWEHRPDGCLDLHNEGLGSTGFDAFGPEGPLLEEEPEALMLRDADLGVREVDAAGGNAGSMNENYRAPEPADEHPNPTSYHPGTHDMFCTTRGAPGWTPEGAIPAGENGVSSPPFNWSTRVHLVSVAASALHWAGAYDAREPTIWKTAGGLAPQVEHIYEFEGAADLRLQAVWRQTSTGGDHNPGPVSFTVTTPDGQTLDGREPGPERWTSTVEIPDAGPGAYALTLTGASTGTYELRAYAEPEGVPLVDIERSPAGLALEALESAPGPVDVTVTDVADATQVDTAVIGADASWTLPGTAGERTLVKWTRTLQPGGQASLDVPGTWENDGPWRFSATSGEVIHTGVEDTENPAPDER